MTANTWRLFIEHFLNPNYSYAEFVGKDVTSASLNTFLIHYRLAIRYKQEGGIFSECCGRMVLPINLRRSWGLTALES